MSQIDIKGQKNFWQRPEGIPGAILLIGALAAAGYGLIQIMPTLITLAENMIYLGAMLGGLFIIGYMVLDQRIRTLVWYFYKSLVRKATGVFIQLDPVAIIEGFLEDLREKMTDMQNQIGKLKGQIRIIKEKIKEKEEKIAHFRDLALAARNMGDNARMNLNNRNAEREIDASEKFSILAEKTEKLYMVLDKMRKYSSIMVEDITHEVEVKKEEREIIRTSHSVMKSAVNIINGNSDRKVIFDQAMEFIADDIGMRIGEMESFMDGTQDFMANMDLENAMYEERGMKALDEWANKVDEKFDAANYESPVKALERGVVKYTEREKVQATQSNTNQNTNTNSKSKYF